MNKPNRHRWCQQNEENEGKYKKKQSAVGKAWLIYSGDLATLSITDDA